MPNFRFNHMELTLAHGTIVREWNNLQDFYGEVFGFSVQRVDALNSLVGQHAVLSADAEGSQFLLLAEHDTPLVAQAPDHLGLLFENRQQVDAVRACAKAWQARDARVEITDYDDLVLQETHTVTRAVYIRYLLPIWFDVQAIEYAPGHAPTKRWTYG